MIRHAVKVVLFFCLACAPGWVATRPPPGACLGICSRVLILGAPFVPNIGEEVSYCVCPVPGPFANKTSVASATPRPASAPRASGGESVGDLQRESAPTANQASGTGQREQAAGSGAASTRHKR
jgi:hypothetical protein